MASLVQKGSKFTAASTTGNVTPSITGVTAHNSLLMFMSCSQNTSTFPTITDSNGAQTWTKAYSTTSAQNGGAGFAIYILPDANAGTHNLTLSMAGSGGTWTVNVIGEFVPLTGTVNASSAVAAGSAGSATAASITTTVANCLVVGILSIDANIGNSTLGISNPPTGFTTIDVLQDSTTYEGAEWCYKDAATAASQGSVTWTFSNSDPSQAISVGQVAFVKSSGGTTFNQTCAASSTVSATKVQTVGAKRSAPSTVTAAFSSLKIKILVLAAAITLTGSTSRAVKLIRATTSTTSATIKKTASRVWSATTTLAAAALPVKPGAPTVTLKQYWYKPWQTSVGAALQTGSDPYTVTAGSTVVALTVGWDATRQIPVNVDSVGTYTIPADAGSQSAVVHTTGSSGEVTSHLSCMANVAGGSHATTVPTINDGTNGFNGELAVWIAEITGMPSALTVRDVSAVHNSSTSTTWSISSDGTVKTGDVILVAGTFENTIAQTDTLLAAPSGFTQIGVNHDGALFVPTQFSYMIATADGAVTASWTTSDTSKTEDYSVMLVLTPAGGATLYTIALLATSAISATSIKGVKAIRSASTTVTGLLVKGVGAVKSTILTSTASIVKNLTVSKAASTTVSGFNTRVAVKLITLLASSTVSAVSQKLASSIKGASTAATASNAKMASIVRSASTTLSAAWTPLKAHFLTLLASTTVIGSITKGLSTVVSASTSVTGTLIKVMRTTKSASSTVSATFGAIKAKLLSLLATISVSASSSKSVSSIRTGATSAIGALTKRISTSRIAQTTVGGLKTTLVTSTMSAVTTCTAAASRSKLLMLQFLAQVTLSASTSRGVQILRSGATSVTSVTSKVVGMTQSALSSVTGSVGFGRVVKMTLLAVTTVTGIIHTFAGLISSFIRRFGFGVDSRVHTFESDGPRIHEFPVDSRTVTFEADIRTHIFPGDQS